MVTYTKEDMEKLYKQYEHMFIKIINKYYKRYDHLFADMMQECYIALVNACNGFNPNKNIKFITYLFNITVRHLSHFLKENSGIMKIPYYESSDGRSKVPFYDCEVVLTSSYGNDLACVVVFDDLVLSSNLSDKMVGDIQLSKILDFLYEKYITQDIELFLGYYVYKYGFTGLAKRYNMTFMQVRRKVLRIYKDVLKEFKGSNDGSGDKI
jgi:RNA polymerase sigma factor (sigma-70 family)